MTSPSQPEAPTKLIPEPSKHRSLHACCSVHHRARSGPLPNQSVVHRSSSLLSPHPRVFTFSASPVQYFCPMSWSHPFPVFRPVPWICQFHWCRSAPRLCPCHHLRAARQLRLPLHQLSVRLSPRLHLRLPRPCLHLGLSANWLRSSYAFPGLHRGPFSISFHHRLPGPSIHSNPPSFGFPVVLAHSIVTPVS